MIARVTLEMALGKEFDYLIPAEMAGRIEVGTRVKVPFANRQVLGCVTALLESSPHPNLRSILKVLGRQSFVSPKILQLARWMGEYYCCPPEIALKTVLPEAVRKERDGWREQLTVRVLPLQGTKPKLSKRQAQVFEIAQKRGEIPLQELLQSADTTAQTLRRLEDKGLITIAPQISERDPYARETILPTESLPLNPEQKQALEVVLEALGGTGVPPVDLGVPPRSPANDEPASESKTGVGSSSTLDQQSGERFGETPNRTGQRPVPPPNQRSSAGGAGVPPVDLGVPPRSLANDEPASESKTEVGASSTPDQPSGQRFGETPNRTGQRPVPPQNQRSSAGGTGVSPVDLGVPPRSPANDKPSSEPKTNVGPKLDVPSTARGLFHPISEPTARRRLLPHFEIPGRIYHVTWRTLNGLILSPEARQKVLEACQFWHGNKMKCYLACVMSDHVHMLMQPLPTQEKEKESVHSLTEILHGIKSFSAHEVNKVMRRNGPVWQQESFDRMIRSETDFHEKWNYIWNNLSEEIQSSPRSFMGGTGVPPVDLGVPPRSPANDEPALESKTGVGGSSTLDQQSGQRFGETPNRTGQRPVPPPNQRSSAGGTGVPPVDLGVPPRSLASDEIASESKTGVGSSSTLDQQSGQRFGETPNRTGQRPVPPPNQRSSAGGPGVSPVDLGVPPRSPANDEPALESKTEVGASSTLDQQSGQRFGETPNRTGQRPVPPQNQRSSAGGTGVPPVDLGVSPGFPTKDEPGFPRRFHNKGLNRPILLHGVTGSGKTEVYLQAIAHTLQQGKGAIVLVPEISLTPQTVERFKARFSSGPGQTLVAVLHSHLSTGERHDEWHKIRQGRARIVIGARSAVFAPVDPLGLIIVDEEHEHSYKQEESPRYHARDIAVVRGQMENAVVVLGSATPSMESFYNVQKGKYRLLELPTRADDKKMPVVRVVDMRQVTRQEKGAPIFSPELKEAIHQRLERGEQTLLFLNRRGFATSLQCPLCGYVAQCPNCSVSLTFHRQAGRLRCHICDYEAVAPTICPDPKCRNPAIRYAGMGTEKVESTIVKLFPKARIRRMDSDTLKRKEDYRRILGDFKTGKIDILVGTQMIAKGLHFPNVTLVGIIYADLSLHLPDFRAGERTFQLLTQVSGRAGRGDVEGEVFVQAFTPFHPAIQYARRHDFAGFYEQEIEFRQQLSYPPISRIALLLMKGMNEEKVKFSATHVRQEIAKWSEEIPDMIIAGPAPAPLARAENKYRYHLMLRTRQMTRLGHNLSGLMAALKLPDDITMTVDIDPVNLM